MISEQRVSGCHRNDRCLLEAQDVAESLGNFAEMEVLSNLDRRKSF